MTYRKPEVLLLGQANILVLGGKGVSAPDGGDITKHLVPDADLDD
jgi:hypothetical protein